MSNIILPHNFTPRDYQLPLLKALDSGYKRVIQVWHRRSGKDKVDFNYLVKEAARVPANYYYFAPTYEQGRKIIWDNIDNNGFRMINHIPQELIKRTDNTRMLVELKLGSTLQIVGTEDVNKIVGTNPRICVFTEYSLQNPVAWDMIAPILLGNGGTAIFNYTPRGKNHAWDLLRFAKKRPKKWFFSLLTADDTKVLSPEALAEEKARLFEKYGDDALYMQEYFCSFEAPVQGAYYGKWLNDAEAEGRIGHVPYDENVPVDTYWDLGIGDSMVIWFVQTVGKEIRLIDYMEVTGEGLNYCIKELQGKKYIYGRHHAPHDIEVRELSSGKSRKEIASTLGIDFEVVPNLPIDDGIDAARRIFKRCWFDADKTERGLNALRSYQKEYDEKNQTYKNHPLHNWASHGSDGFRYLAVGYEDDIDDGEVPDETEQFAGIY